MENRGKESIIGMIFIGIFLFNALSISFYYLNSDSPNSVIEGCNIRVIEEGDTTIYNREYITYYNRDEERIKTHCFWSISPLNYLPSGIFETDYLNDSVVENSQEVNEELSLSTFGDFRF